MSAQCLKDGAAEIMRNKLSRSFNWITGGSFNQTFSARIYSIAHQSEQAEWPWHIVSVIDFFLGKQHCFNEWLGKD